MSLFNFVFDLDGTITSQELLPLIARDLGIEQEMSELTMKTMAGEIPFDHSFRNRVDMLKNIPISRVQQIVSQVNLSTAIVNFMKDFNEQVYVATGNLDVWLKPLINSLPGTFYCSQADFKEDSLFGIKHIYYKEEIYKHISRPVIAIGDGNNDFELLRQSDIAIAYGGVHPPADSLLDICHFAVYSDEELCRLIRQL